MPTADAFEAAAAAFEQAAESLDLLLTATPTFFGPDTLQGGLLTMVADLTVSTTTATARSASTALNDQAAMCRERASICRAFATDMVIYWRELDQHHSALALFDSSDVGGDRPRRPMRPDRPFTWVDV